MKGLYMIRSKRVLRKLGSSAAEGLSLHQGPVSFSAISVQVGKFCEWGPVRAGVVLCLCSLLLLQAVLCWVASWPETSRERMVLSGQR